MTDPTPAPPSTASTILIKAQELSGKKFDFSFSIGKLLMWAALIGVGYYWGTRACTGMDATVARQLEGKLTAKEELIVAANLEKGKLESALKDKAGVEAQLKADNKDLFDRAQEEARAHKLDIAGFSRIIANLKAEIVGKGKAGITDAVIAAASATECGTCKGQVSFGGYASCAWADYASLKTGQPKSSKLSLSLGVRVDQVQLRQDPRSGALEATIGKAYLLGDNGEVLAEGKLAEGSRSFNTPAIRGDLSMRHFYALSGIDARSYKVGVLTQKGVKPLVWGAMLTQDFRGTGGLGAELLLGWQLR